MKKGPLSNAEKYTIEGMYWGNSKGVEEIAEFLGRNPKSIEKHLETLEPKVEEEAPKGKNETQFVRNTAAKNNKGVSVMTEAESSRSEMTKGKTQSKIVERFRPVIHQITEDDG